MVTVVWSSKQRRLSILSSKQPWGVFKFKILNIELLLNKKTMNDESRGKKLMNDLRCDTKHWRRQRTISILFEIIQIWLSWLIRSPGKWVISPVGHKIILYDDLFLKIDGSRIKAVDIWQEGRMGAEYLTPGSRGGGRGHHGPTL